MRQVKRIILPMPNSIFFLIEKYGFGAPSRIQLV